VLSKPKRIAEPNDAAGVPVDEWRISSSVSAAAVVALSIETIGAALKVCVPVQLSEDDVSTETSSALTVIPTPAPTANERLADRSPPPVNPAPAVNVTELAAFAFNCVWIADVTPDKWPSSVLVTEDTDTKPEPSDTKAREAVNAASLEYAIAADALTSAFTIDPERFSFE